MAEPKDLAKELKKIKWQVRRNPITGKRVIFSDSENILKPYTYKKGKEEASCGLCPGGEIVQKSLTINKWQYPTYSIQVIPSPQHILSIDIPFESRGYGTKEDFETGYGANELIIETSEHNRRAPQFSEEQIANVFFIYQDRIKNLLKDDKIRHICIFKDTAVPMEIERHEYSQLVGSHHRSELLENEIKGALQYFDLKERCGWCDTQRELTIDLLVMRQKVAEKQKEIIAYAPYASTRPYEICIQSTEHNSNFMKVSEEEIKSLAASYKKVYASLEKLWPDSPINFCLDNLLRPQQKKEESAYHWHFVMWPFLITGFESCDLDVNLAMPEKVAEKMREAIKEIE